jgi:hypothetical protein
MKKSFILLQASIIVLMLTFISFKASAQSGPSTPGLYSPPPAAAADQIVCSGVGISIKAPLDATSTYVWRKQTSSGWVVVKGPGTAGDNVYTETPTATAGYYTYTVEQINSNGCSDISLPFNIYVLPLITPSITGEASYCANQLQQPVLSINGLVNGYTYNYQWTKNGVDITTNGTSATYTVTDATVGSNAYAVKVTFALGASSATPCSYPSPAKTVQVYAVPTKPVITIN